MKTYLSRFAVFAVFFLAVQFSSQAQQQSQPQEHSQNAHLSGTLVDLSGAGVGGVQITARLEADTGAQVWKTNSSADGTFSLAIPPGRYLVWIALTPFIPRDFVLDFGANEQRRLDQSLELSPLSSSVVVTAETEPILVDQTTASASVITKEEIDARQSVMVTDALLFAPGVAHRAYRAGGRDSFYLSERRQLQLHQGASGRHTD